MRTGLLLIFLLVGALLSGQVPRLVVPIGHTGSINAVAFSPDGKYVLTGGSDETAKLWDLSGRKIQSFQNHIFEVLSIAFSPDGKYILTCSGDSAKLLDLSGHEIQSFSGHNWAIHSVAFSPNTTSILTSIGDSTKLWDLSGHEILSFGGHSSYVMSAVFSPDGKHILTGSLDGKAKLWDLSGREIQSFKGHTEYVNSVAFSPDGNYVLTGSSDSIAKLWDLSGHEIQSFRGHTDWVMSVAFSPNGKQILTGSSDGTAKLWDLSGYEIQSFRSHDSGGMSAIFSPDGKQVLTGSSDGKANLWDLSGHEILSFGGHSSYIMSSVFSPDGKYVLTANSDDKAKLWDLSGREIQSFKGHTEHVNSVAFSPDGNYVLTGSSDSIAKLWDLSGHEIQSFRGHADRVMSVAFSQNGKQILTGSSDGTARLWDLSGYKIQSFSGHDSDIESVAFSPDGKYVLTGSWDNTAKLWDLSGNEIQTFNGHTNAITSVAFSPDGNYILTGSSDNTAKLWNSSGYETQDFNFHSNSVTSVVFSPNGQNILTGSDDYTAIIWDLKGQELRSFKGHTLSVNSVTFSPGGTYVLTASVDNTTKLWNTNTGQELATLIAIDSTDWVVTTPSGLFDASPGAMKLMHYMVGLEVIDLEQLKDRYYEPGLLAKIMGFAEGGLRPVEALKEVALYPAITKATLTGDRLHVELEKRSGGIGKVTLLLDDHIELDTNTNPGFKTTFDVDLRRFAGHFYPDSMNRLSLRTYNHDGWLKSQPYQLSYRPTTNNALTPNARREQQLDSINLYALVVGTSHFRGEQLNLKYPDVDATAFAEALRLAGKPLFGKNIEVQLLTTAAEPWPRKAQIARAMRDIATKADPNDILLVYFSGHGITYPPNSEKGQFYYLTTDIGSDKLDDPAVLAAHAIAQDTLQEWIRQIKARKRILILDACNSGRVVERLEPGAKELNSDQRRALEQMKDRSGMFVLAGSAADKSSFEASRYGHGLLTYSLLNNMPIVAAANKHFIQVDKLFGNVREEVPRLAKGIGKVQDPELIGGETYAIGLIRDTFITLPKALPVFVRTVFIDSQRNKDLLHLSTAVNDYLERRATEKEPPFAYWAVDEFAGDHYYLGGQYQQNGEKVSGKATLYREDKELASFPFSGDKNALGGLAEGILGVVFGWLNEHRD